MVAATTARIDQSEDGCGWDKGTGADQSEAAFAAAEEGSPRLLSSGLPADAADLALGGGVGGSGVGDRPLNKAAVVAGN